MPKSEYELQREARIEENKQVLKKLGLLRKNPPKIVHPGKKGKKRKKPSRDKPPTLPRRKSLRLQRKQPEGGTEPTLHGQPQTVSVHDVDRDVYFELPPVLKHRKKSTYASGPKGGSKPPANASYEHTYKRVRSMSEAQLRRRISAIERAKGTWAALKMQRFAEVLALEGYMELADEATASLNRLLLLPKYSHSSKPPEEMKLGKTPAKQSTSNTKAVWYWLQDLERGEQDPSSWKPYSSEEIEKIEAAFAAGQTIFEVNDKYAINFPAMIQYQIVDDYRQRKIKRERVDVGN